jgi:poly-gamma-glutamate synthesis protein (capsule biosynthesis protein)
VVSHHAHISKGIEIHRGKPIFHGLGNFVCVTRQWEITDKTASDAWARKRRQLYGFENDPNYPTNPWHPEAKNVYVAKLLVDGTGQVETRYVPCFTQPYGSPEPVKRSGRGQEVFDYMAHITASAGLETNFAWDGDEVVVTAG